MASSVSGLGCIVRFGRPVLDRLFQPSDSLPKHKNDDLALVEFPSLCIASIAGRFVKDFIEDSPLPQALRSLEDELKLSDAEHSILAINSSDLVVGVSLLDAAVEGVLNAWEAFAGRRSWLGRRVVQLKCAYANIRNDFVTQHTSNDIGLSIPAIKISSSTAPNWKSQSSNAKKKNDRRALERGAEVIRCLCGFRVEGGHVMVQCDRCSSWQHLPCLWWALSLATREESGKPINSAVSTLCRTALLAAQAAGAGELSDIGLDAKNEGIEAPYFCPVCLNLDDLTKDYPRSLSAAMSINSLDSVFSLQDATVEGEHEFWTLATPDGSGQIQTDDYAFIHRSWLDYTVPKRITSRSIPENLNYVIETAYDRVVVRIYRLWKDTSGVSWFEGGLFLRPYDLPKCTNSPNPDNTSLWHLHEVIYDEASRIVLPLKAWSGRCIVLSPSAYRAGCPADLVIREELDQFLPQLKGDRTTSTEDNDSIAAIRLSFVCDKLFERTNPIPEGQLSQYRLEEISPGYLKVNMKPYCFLRKPEIQFGRAVLHRNFTALQLLERDKSINLSKGNGNLDKELEQSSEKQSGHHSDDSTKFETTVSYTSHKKPKGEKLARVVDWLEKKLQSCPTDADATDVFNSDVNELSPKPLEVQPFKADETALHLTNVTSPLPRSGRSRGRASRSNQVADTIDSASGSSLLPNTDNSSDKNPQESGISSRSKRLRASSKESIPNPVDSLQFSPLNTADAILKSCDDLSISPPASINIQPENLLVADLNTTSSPKSDTNEPFVTDPNKLTSPPPITSPLSSSDEQLGITQSKGSSRKRKRSITRKCVTLNHIREESTSSHSATVGSDISGNHEIKLVGNNSTPLASPTHDATQLTSNVSSILQNYISFLVYDEEFILDLDMVHSCEEFARFSSHPEFFYQTPVVKTCLAVSRQAEVKKQEKLADLSPVQDPVFDVLTKQEDLGNSGDPDPLTMNDPIENTSDKPPSVLQSQQTVKQDTSSESELIHVQEPLQASIPADRKLTETSFSVESVLLDDRETSLHDETHKVDAQIDEQAITSTDKQAMDYMDHGVEAVDATLENLVSENSIIAAENQDSVIDQMQILPTNSQQDNSLAKPDLGNDVDNTLENDSFLEPSNLPNIIDLTQLDYTTGKQIGASNHCCNIDTNQISTEISDFHPSTNTTSPKSEHACNSPNCDEFNSWNNSPTLVNEPWPTVFKSDTGCSPSYLNAPDTTASLIHDVNPRSDTQNTCSVSPQPGTVSDPSEAFDSLHPQTDDSLTTHRNFSPVSAPVNSPDTSRTTEDLVLNVANPSSNEITSEKIQSKPTPGLDVDFHLSSCANKTSYDNITPQNSMSPVVLCGVQSEPSPTVNPSADIRTTDDNLSPESVLESLASNSNLDLYSTKIGENQLATSECDPSSTHELGTPLDVSHGDGNTPLLDEPASSDSVLQSVSSPTIPEYLCCASGSFTPVPELASKKLEPTVESTEFQKSTVSRLSGPKNSSETSRDRYHHSHHRSHSRHHHSSKDPKRYSSSNRSSSRSEKSSREHHSHKTYRYRDDCRHHSKPRHHDDYKSSHHSFSKSSSHDPSPNSRHRDRSHSSSSRSSHHRYHGSKTLPNHSTSDDQTYFSNLDSQKSAINLPKNEALDDFKKEKGSFPDSSSPKQP